MGVGEVFLEARGMSIWEAALALAEGGMPIFPCASRGKRPLTRTGFHDASSDRQQVCSWWTRWPAANIGIPTGDVSGIEVVDVDLTGAGSGFPLLHRASRAGLIGRELARVRTPSGGLHLYFPSVASRPQSCWQAAAAHIDFRGNGGYVIAPPSVLATPKGPTAYTFLSVSTAGATPIDSRALRDFIDPLPPQSRTGSRTQQSSDAERLSAWVSNLKEGERNHGLFWAACRLAEAGHAQAAIEEALAPAAGSAGLPAREISVTIQSAVRRAVASAAADTSQATWCEKPVPGDSRPEGRWLS
jgi:Bifunctional DNA primase/polymerase, N-terminal